jgi:hypothetical protein
MVIIFLMVIGFPVILFFGTYMYKDNLNVALIYGFLATIWCTVFCNKYIMTEFDFVYRQQIDIIVLYVIPIIFLISIVERVYNYKKTAFNN